MIKPYQKKNPYEVEKTLLTTTDKLGLPIDKGIFRSVVILNSLGFITTGSCEGHKDRYNTNPYINISFQNDPKDNLDECKELFFNTLYKDLQDFYNNKQISHDKKIVIESFESRQFEIRLNIATTLKVYGKDRKKMLKEHFTELSEFCEFLNKKYQLNY